MVLSGFIVFLIGLALVVIGIILAAARRSSQERRGQKEEKKQSGKGVRGSGVVLIGPIPIVFGTDRIALIIALCAAVVLMLLYLILLLSP